MILFSLLSNGHLARKKGPYHGYQVFHNLHSFQFPDATFIPLGILQFAFHWCVCWSHMLGWRYLLLLHKSVAAYRNCRSWSPSGRACRWAWWDWSVCFRSHGIPGRCWGGLTESLARICCLLFESLWKSPYSKGMRAVPPLWCCWHN